MGKILSWLIKAWKYRRVIKAAVTVVKSVKDGKITSEEGQQIAGQVIEAATDYVDTNKSIQIAGKEKLCRINQSLKTRRQDSRR